MSVVTHSDTTTQATAPGAWWWHHREFPSLAYKGGTYCVTMGHFLTDHHAILWNRLYGAVMDDFGNLRPVKELS